MIRTALVTLLASESLAAKILCLHGGGSSAAALETATADLRSALGTEYEFVFASAPYSGNLWMADPPGGKDVATTDPDWAADSISLLDSIVEAQGPFYAILGYSQGSAFAPVYLSTVAEGTFQVALLFCGYLPTTHEGLLGRIDGASPFGGMAALAWIGSNDVIISASMTQAQAAKFTSPTVITSSSGGHDVPGSSDPTFDEVVAFITSHAAASADAPSEPPLPPGTAQSPSPSPPPPSESVDDSAAAATTLGVWQLACSVAAAAMLLRSARA